MSIFWIIMITSSAMAKVSVSEEKQTRYLICSVEKVVERRKVKMLGYWCTSTSSAPMPTIR